MATRRRTARDLHVHEGVVLTQIIPFQELLADIGKCGGVYSPNLQFA